MMSATSGMACRHEAPARLCAAFPRPPRPHAPLFPASGGHPRIPLPGLEGSEEFAAAYSAALAATAGPTSMIGASRAKPGTVSALVAAYFGWMVSAEGELSPETQRSRRHILERFREEHGDKRIAGMRR
jgi:hypothetical protein